MKTKDKLLLVLLVILAILIYNYPQILCLFPFGFLLAFLIWILIYPPKSDWDRMTEEERRAYNEGYYTEKGKQDARDEDD